MLMILIASLSNKFFRVIDKLKRETKGIDVDRQIIVLDILKSSLLGEVFNNNLL